MSEPLRTSTDEVTEALDGYRATTIPVHIEVDVKQTVVNLAEAEKILRNAKSIALGDCVCRTEGQHCDKPVHVCLALDQSIEKAKESNDSFHSVSVEDALSVLRLSHEAGLVHLAFRKQNGDIHEFCSCCECCCWFLDKLKRFDYHDGVAESSHIAKQLPESCVACGACVRACPFDAWKAIEEGAKPSLIASKCFGCGVCVSACPTQAIAFVSRTEIV